MALLDELDQIDGTLGTAMEGKATIGETMKSSVATGAPLRKEAMAAAATLVKTPQSSSLPPTNNLLSSELDMVMNDFSPEDLVIANDPEPAVVSQSATDSVEKAAPVATIAKSRRQAAAAVDENDIFQFLPFPFYPDTFGLPDWQRNAATIRKSFSMYPWERAVQIPDIRNLGFGHRCPLMLLMIRAIYASVARNVGVMLVDELGNEINATIHEAVFSQVGSPKPHIGMSFILQDTTIFYQHLDSDIEEAELNRHLVICPRNILRLLSNVHFI